ncbi:hypothetical protein ACLOJK_018323 [Asimina triloba]
MAATAWPPIGDDPTTDRTLPPERRRHYGHDSTGVTPDRPSGSLKSRKKPAALFFLRSTPLPAESVFFYAACCRSFNSGDNPSSPHAAITSQQCLTTLSAIFSAIGEKTHRLP